MGTMIRLVSRLLAAGVPLLCLAGCGGQNAGVTPSLNPGASYSLSSSIQIAKPGLPIVEYLVVTRPGGNREFVYFMIIKPPAAGVGGSRRANSSQGGSMGVKAHAKSKTTINGKEFVAEYNMTVRPDAELESESFVLNGKNQSFDKGRVFLVDMSSDPIGIAPHNIPLPTKMPPDLRNPGSGETLAASTLQELEKDPAIAEFTRGLR